MMLNVLVFNASNIWFHVPYLILCASYRNPNHDKARDGSMELSS